MDSDAFMANWYPTYTPTQINLWPADRQLTRLAIDGRGQVTQAGLENPGIKHDVLKAMVMWGYPPFKEPKSSRSVKSRVILHNVERNAGEREKQLHKECLEPQESMAYTTVILQWHQQSISKMALRKQIIKLNQPSYQ